MDPKFSRVLDPPVNAFKYEGDILYPKFSETPSFINGFQSNENDLYHNVTSSSMVSEVDSTDNNDSDHVLKYINQVLLEENEDERPSMFIDPLTLQAAEKSWYEALSDTLVPPVVNSGENSLTRPFTVSSTHDSNRVVDPGDNRSFMGHSLQAEGITFGNLVQSISTDSDSMLHFKKGIDEASKFLPNANQFFIDLDMHNLPSKTDQISLNLNIKLENYASGSRGTKHLNRQESQLDEVRSSKQSAVYVEELELSEMFDRVLLFTDANKDSTYDCNVQASEASKTSNGSTGGKNQNRSRNRVSESETIDLRTLLIHCAQSVAADDRRIAIEQLKQIRKHSSVKGDALQRLASIFANGLEARLAGNGIHNQALYHRHFSASKKLKAFQVYLSACPFRKISILFANNMILQAASKATTLHIVDFGILNGFQWPILIQHLSNLPGPPRLRITGIEHPKPGFRPTEHVVKTWHLLAQYCERFHVPFEYKAITSQYWETLTVEDLNIVEGEVLAVNNIHRFKNLLNETIMVDNPRDTVLKLIKKMNPDIFVNSIENGGYNSPFFMARFREALFHFSSLFDMFDATLPSEDEHRLFIEQDFFGPYAMDVIACEGAKRVERPETYKQWQVRLNRIGFKPLPINKELLNELRLKVKADYHKDFDFDEDGSWMLQGWKGRILCASSCWLPT